eukprot:359460-Chlamydomonas_euryale.AAC.5
MAGHRGRMRQAQLLQSVVCQITASCQRVGGVEWYVTSGYTRQRSAEQNMVAQPNKRHRPLRPAKGSVQGARPTSYTISDCNYDSKTCKIIRFARLVITGQKGIDKEHVHVLLTRARTAQHLHVLLGTCMYCSARARTARHVHVLLTHACTAPKEEPDQTPPRCLMQTQACKLVWISAWCGMLDLGAFHTRHMPGCETMRNPDPGCLMKP